MKSRWLIFSFLLLGFACGHKPSVETPAFSQDTFLVRPASTDSAQSRYRVYVPQSRKPGERLPVMLYLHGSDERGSDNESQLNGVASLIEEHPETFPFIVVFPQCPADRFWDSDRIFTAMSELDETVNEFDGDESRLYLAGFSLGGYATWTIAARYPNKFAAVVPMSGRLLPRPAERQGVAAEILELADARDPYTAFASRLQNTPIWIFHGANDPVVPVENSRRMAKSLRDVGNQNFRYTELEKMGHVSLNAAFTSSDLFQWLADQKRTNISYENLEISADMVYGAVLEAMAYDSQDGAFGSFAGGVPLNLKHETIASSNATELRAVTSLPRELVEDFIKNNAAGDKLRDDGYDAKINIGTVPEEGSVEEIFVQNKKKDPKLWGVIGLSKVGFDKDHSRSLVYVELFNSKGAFIKHYCPINWKGEGTGIRVASTRWIL